MALRFGSRKFIAATLNAGVLIILPFLYKFFEIDQGLLMIVLPTITTLTGMYLSANVIEKKIGSDGAP